MARGTAVAGLLLVAACSVAPGGSTPSARRDGSGREGSGRGSGSLPPASTGAPAGTYTVPEAARECARTTLARMTPTDRAGQVLMVATPVHSPATALGVVRAYRLGGVFLHGRSAVPISGLAPEVKDLRDRSRSGGVPLHVAVDQEGGKVQTLRGTGIGALASALEQGTWDTALLERRTKDWTKSLRTVGVTMNFAPVTDTVPANRKTQNPPIGALGRQYGSDPATVATKVTAVVRGSQAAGVQATLKHFPGLGRVTVNTDFSDGAVDATATEDDAYLRPFVAGVAAGAGAVMMSSARYPKLDAGQPAVFSEPIISMLRTNLGFTGLVVSDDLGVAKAVQDRSAGQRAVDFIAAGGDMVLTVRRQDAGVLGQALVTRARGSAAFRARLDEAVVHVLLSKHRAGILPC
ncbi:MAG: beta-N-acetylhexosaminidase [Actinomycetota bacterium]|nr:beta-N-acetylhexosaminidase [Actinomycetota bacterium]